MRSDGENRIDMDSRPTRESIATAFDAVDANLESMDELLERLSMKLQPVLHNMPTDTAEDPRSKEAPDDGHSDVYRWAQSRSDRLRRQRNIVAALIERVDL